MTPKILVVIPTYNEKEILPALVGKISALKIPGLRMLVVDDNSPDGTGALADQLGRVYPLTVLHRQRKEGLGRAYAHAFDFILSSPDKPDYMVQMDADLSHDPAAIPAMMEIIKKCDVALGSRYVAGGRIENWDWLRRLVSRIGNFYARAVLGLPYRDLTGGFKCFRLKVLEDLDLSLISSTGYNFQIETTYRAHKKGYKICELPITFTERRAGVSKFNLGIILESFWKVLWLRFRKI